MKKNNYVRKHVSRKQEKMLHEVTKEKFLRGEPDLFFPDMNVLKIKISDFPTPS